MGIAIPAGLTDDNDFVVLLNGMIDGLLRRHVPDLLWVVQVDNWFDHKWLRFSGYGTAAFRPSIGPVQLLGFPFNRFDSVKKEFYQDHLTLPPFAPDRVLAQWSFERVGQTYVEAPVPELPHKPERNRSALNLQRRIQVEGGPVLFVWFSGNTLKNGKASVMVYCVGGVGDVVWFASFHGRGGWQLQRTKGVSEAEIRDLIPTW